MPTVCIQLIQNYTRSFEKGYIISRFIWYAKEYTVVCISLETRSVAKQVSVAVGWDKLKILLMAQLKGLTAKFKLM